ncbi:MAG: DUF1045 domain-containing protein [Burkholderiaceae bacterium]|nr:DUF1045 domain-containing protein [Burkholderiaceae bacterium]
MPPTIPPSEPSAHRYAIYFAPPPDSPLGRAGAHWLGRCAATGQARPQPALPLPAPGALHHLTRDPRRYGWHATLKAPFTLAEGLAPSDLRRAVQALAATRQPFELPPLAPHWLGHFLALVPDPAQQAHPGCAALNALAAACTTELHPLAQPLSDAELARRRQKSTLSPAQDQYLQRWGYPHVLDRYRFHLTLSDSLAPNPEGRGAPAALRQALTQAAQAHFADLPAGRCTHLVVFAEPAPGADFQWFDAVELGR